MEQKLQDPKGLKEYIDKVRCAGNYPLRLINDVLDLVRMESGQLILDDVKIEIPFEVKIYDTKMSEVISIPYSSIARLIPWANEITCMVRCELKVSPSGQY